jgi:hypothetical protein
MIKYSWHGISTEPRKWTSLEPVQTEIQIKKKILYEQLCIFTPNYLQVYQLVSQLKIYFILLPQCILLLHLISHFFIEFLYESWEKRTNRYVTSSLSSSQSHNYIPTGRLPYWLVRRCTQSSQNQGMQWFTELLRHFGRVVTFRRLWVKFLSSGVVTKNETWCGIPWTTPQVPVHITEGSWVSNKHNFAQALYCVFCYMFL